MSSRLFRCTRWDFLAAYAHSGWTAEPLRDCVPRGPTASRRDRSSTLNLLLHSKCGNPWFELIQTHQLPFLSCYSVRSAHSISLLTQIRSVCWPESPRSCCRALWPLWTINLDPTRCVPGASHLNRPVIAPEFPAPSAPRSAAPKPRLTRRQTGAHTPLNWAGCVPAPFLPCVLLRRNRHPGGPALYPPHFLPLHPAEVQEAPSSFSWRRLHCCLNWAIDCGNPNILVATVHIDASSICQHVQVREPSSGPAALHRHQGVHCGRLQGPLRPHSPAAGQPRRYDQA